MAASLPEFGEEQTHRPLNILVSVQLCGDLIQNAGPFANALAHWFVLPLPAEWAENHTGACTADAPVGRSIDPFSRIVFLLCSFVQQVSAFPAERRFLVVARCLTSRVCPIVGSKPIRKLRNDPRTHLRNGGWGRGAD